MMQTPHTYTTPQNLHFAAADFWVASYAAAVIEHGYFHVALSGGTTPKKLYEILASPDFQSKINWEKVHLYFGDERYVQPDHPDSNFKMINDALLSHVNIPKENIHTPPILLPASLDTATKTATQYEDMLKHGLPHTDNLIPQFDLVLLGLGTDGHTASLFPHTEAISEKKKLCCAVFVKDKQSWRISITFPLINNAKKILLLSEGESKFPIIKILTDPSTPALQFPIQHTRQTAGFFWYADNAAVFGKQ